MRGVCRKIGRTIYEAVYYVVGDTFDEAKHDALNCFLEDTGKYPSGYYVEKSVKPYTKGIWRDFLWENIHGEEYTKELGKVFKR
jgi:hypothetical protein